MSAVILLQELMLAKKLDPQAFADDEEEDLPAETTKDRTAVLAIAYHNMGVEQEFLKSYPAAILSYKKAVNFAEKNLGPEDGITQNLRNVFENAKLEVMLFLNFSPNCMVCLQLDSSLYKKGKRGKGKGKKMEDMGAYDNMMTPRHVSTLTNKLI